MIDEADTRSADATSEAGGREDDLISRRRMLALLAASSAFGGALGCTSPSDRGAAVPYTKKAPQITPGIANFYASSFQQGVTVHPVLIKTREGRPIHVTGNDLHPHSLGKTTLPGMADILSLYDPARSQQALVGGEPKSLDAAQRLIVGALRAVQSGGKTGVLVTPALMSPSRRALIQQLTDVLPNLRHRVWEPSVVPASLRAQQTVFGRAVEIRCRLKETPVLLALESDFLSSSGLPGSELRAFGAARDVQSPSDSMNRLYVVEGRMSITGMNADRRMPLRPSLMAEFIWHLAAELRAKHKLTLRSELPVPPEGLARFVSENNLDKQFVELLVADLGRGNAGVMVGAGLPEDAQVAGYLRGRLQRRELEVCLRLEPAVRGRRRQ